jgi:hypothetical protein
MSTTPRSLRGWAGGVVAERAVVGADAVTDRTRPLILGYIRPHLLMTDDELAVTKAVLARFAEHEGYALGTVFTEHSQSAPTAFMAMIDTADRDGAVAVVVPSPLHLAVLGGPKLTHYLRTVASLRVLVANGPP